VPYEGDADTLAHRLTMLGLEVEEIGNPFAALAPIVVGHVVERAAHPSSDHLSVCKVDIGTGEVLELLVFVIVLENDPAVDDIPLNLHQIGVQGMQPHQVGMLPHDLLEFLLIADQVRIGEPTFQVLKFFFYVVKYIDHG
jgi:hypothetical protein